jgi:butyrate kinase
VDPCVVDPMGPSSRLEGIQLSKKIKFKALGDKTLKKKPQL